MTSNIKEKMFVMSIWDCHSLWPICNRYHNWR